MTIEAHITASAASTHDGARAQQALGDPVHADPLQRDERQRDAGDGGERDERRGAATCSTCARRAAGGRRLERRQPLRRGRVGGRPAR